MSHARNKLCCALNLQDLWGQACNELHIIKYLHNSWNPGPIMYLVWWCIKAKTVLLGCYSCCGIPHHPDQKHHCMTRHWNKRQHLLSQLMREKYTIHSFPAPICFSNPFFIDFVSLIVLRNIEESFFEYYLVIISFGVWSNASTKYLHNPVSLSVITLRINFVLYNP